MSDNQVDVKITAETGDFSNSIQKASNALSGFGVTTEKIIGAVKLFSAALAVNEIKEWGEEIGKAAEQMQRTAEMTGLTTDAVQEFNFAVIVGGGNAESAASILMRLERNMVEAKDATSQAALAFKAMGIETKDSEGKIRPVQAVLNDIAIYFEKTSNGAAKTALAMQLMGRSGAQLIPILNLGSKGLEEMNAQLDKTNSKMSPDQLKKFTELDDAIDILNKSWEGFKIAVSEFFEPAYKMIVNGLTEIVQWATRGINAINEFSYSITGIGKNPLSKDTDSNKPEAATPLSTSQVAQAKSLSTELLKLKKLQDEQFMGLDAIRNQHALDIGQKTNQEFLSAELKLAEKKAEIDAQYFQSRKKAAKDDQLELAKIENERLQTDIKNSEDIAKIKAKMSEESIKDYKKMFDVMTSGFESMTEKLIRGTATFKDAFKQMCGDLIVEFAKMQVANVAKALWAAAIGKGISLQTAIMERSANAVKAASATYASVSSIPYVGWLMAPAAAAGAFAGVMAFGLPSAAGGWGEVPSDGLAMIHKKEMVLPAPLAEKVRNMTDSGGSGMTFNIHALDGNSVKDMFMKNGSLIMQSIQNQQRNLNPYAMGK